MDCPVSEAAHPIMGVRLGPIDKIIGRRRGSVVSGLLTSRNGEAADDACAWFLVFTLQNETDRH